MDIRNSQSFIYKKWALITFGAIGIVGSVILDFLTAKIMDDYVRSHYSVGLFTTQEDIDNLRLANKLIVYIGSAFAILINLGGSIGAYKEHYCLTMTYAILRTLSALGSIFLDTRSGAYAFITVNDSIICIIAYMLMHDLRQIRMQSYQAPIYVTSPAHTQTVTHVPGPSYGQGYQPGQPTYGQGYQPGQPTYGQGYQPGQSTYVQGYQPQPDPLPAWQYQHQQNAPVQQSSAWQAPAQAQEPYPPPYTIDKSNFSQNLI